MKISKKTIMVAALLIGTAITLITSIEHHRIVAESYGEVANIFVPLIAISSLALGAFISIIFQWGINVIQFEKIAKLLPDNESNVIKTLFSKRKMTQLQLSSETGLSRLAISRAITNLEEKGVITKKPLENTNLIESKLYSSHPAANALTRLPGLSENRMIIVISIVFLFGISLSILNNFHVFAVEHPIEPSLYLLAIEFFAIGVLSNYLFRKRISSVQFEKILGLLPADEREIIKCIFTEGTTTQRDLVEKTKVYKMKVSRMLEKFEQKGIVERKPYGYTNIVISKL